MWKYPEQKRTPKFRRLYDNTCWSQIQKSIYNIVDPRLKINVHGFVVSGYRGLSQFFISMNFPSSNSSEVIFNNTKASLNGDTWDYDGIQDDLISNLLKYLDTPKSEILFKPFDDTSGLIDILRCLDKRIGRRSLIKLESMILLGSSPNKKLCLQILAERFSHKII